MRHALYSTALLIASTVQAHAQNDALASTKRVVQTCVSEVRTQAFKPENFEFGQPPMWKNFDAYVSPDGRVFNNARLNGEAGGVYRFEKCLAEHGFSLGGAPSPAASAAPKCTDEQLNNLPGECWTKLSSGEKSVYALGFQDGWIQNYKFNEKQQYEWMGSKGKLRLLSVDIPEMITYFDGLYSARQNWPIWFMDAYDLALRKKTNPNTIDLPLLTTMYREHKKPLFNGYLQKFLPPNKVVVAEFSDSSHSARLIEMYGNKTNTVTLLGISGELSSKLSDFMTALLNVRQCNTLIRSEDYYKYIEFKTEKERENAKNIAKGRSTQLEILISYPVIHPEQQEEFFNHDHELSGVLLLEKNEQVCDRKMNDMNWLQPVTVGDLMLAGSDQKDLFSPLWLNDNKHINLNAYIVANGLQKAGDAKADPREAAAQLFSSWLNVGTTKEGVQTVLRVGGSAP